MKGIDVAGWADEYWESADLTAVPRRDRRSGPYQTYRPDSLATTALLVEPALAVRFAEAERAIAALSSGEHASALESIARFLLRSEAVASSMLEGITPSPQQVAIAELAQEEDVRGFSDQARLVANNITVLRRATEHLAERPQVEVADIVDLHAALLPEEQHRALRQVQNWIGGSNWHPLDAAFVPPAPDQVPALMADLVSYLNGSAHAPLVQAALLHAQFETIHPFTDGNGRVGRALIHTVLVRRRLMTAAILPISLVLNTFRERYVAGLTKFRHASGPSSADAEEATNDWLTIFVMATEYAVSEARRLAADIAEVRSDWAAKVAEHRRSGGRRAVPRADSATARLLQLLPDAPLVTTRTLQRLLRLSFPAARAALDELADAGILQRRKVERNTTGYVANDILDLVTLTERRLASTRFDTRLATPNRPVPAPPKRPLGPRS